MNPLLSHVRTEYTSVYGKVTTEWTRSADGGLQLSVSLPANTSATVQLPQGAQGEIKQDGAPISINKVEIGSGDTIFTVR